MQACCFPRTVLGRCALGGRASPSSPRPWPRVVPPPPCPRPWPRSAQVLSRPARLCGCGAGAAQAVCLSDGHAASSHQPRPGVWLPFLAVVSPRSWHHASLPGGTGPRRGGRAAAAEPRGGAWNPAGARATFSVLSSLPASLPRGGQGSDGPYVGGRGRNVQFPFQAEVWSPGCCELGVVCTDVSSLRGQWVPVQPSGDGKAETGPSVKRPRV